MSRDDNGWSKLCPDLLQSIFESLSCLDFHRARTVCSNWYAVSQTCPLYPWRIVIRGENSVLFDPLQDKIYTKNLLGIDLSKFHCLASYGNWILIVDPSLDFHLLNVFTREAIKLPSLESSLRGDRPLRFIRNEEFEYFLELYGTKFLLTWNDFRFEKTAILWVDGRTGDYVVAWTIKQFYIVSYKKIGNDDDADADDDAEDKRWSITCTQCEDMAYKDNKLYVYTFDHYINILDFSGDCPKETKEVNPYLSHPFRFVDTIYKLRLAVTIEGEVLIVLSSDDRKFSIFKLNLEIGDWERVESLGDEMLIFGHGVTIRAPVKDISGGGLKSDSICFLDDDHLFDNTMKRQQPSCGVFDLATSTITWHTRLEDLSSKICWFVPGYAN